MKRTLLLLLCCAGFMTVSAQDNPYRAAMKKNVASLEVQKSATQLAALAGNFQRIAGSNSDQWLPLYYTSLCLVKQSFMQKDKDLMAPLLDKADRFAKKADALHPDKAEMLCLHAMIASARIMVDPRQRGSQYGPVSNGLLQQASEAAPDNPRVYLLLGEGAFYTPAAWGGGKAKARPLLEKALRKFAVFKPVSGIAPDWGESTAAHFLALCKQ